MEHNSLQTLLVLAGRMIRYQCAFCDDTERKKSDKANLPVS
jgi:hypothetical protein